MLSIAFSNRFENLLDALLARMEASRLRGPFVRGQVIVPGSAFRRRIELAMADCFGIGAGVDFDTLSHYLWRQVGRVVAGVQDVSPYAPAVLVWRVFAALDGDWREKHARLARYLQGADVRQRFELAGRLARLFDHYLCYRPEWLEKWAAGDKALAVREGNFCADEAWQAELWRRIHAEGESPRLPFLEFLRQAEGMGDDTLAGMGLPAEVDVFCLPTLPPLYLGMLRALARVTEVRLYVLNPCREYWFDIVDARRLSWLARKQRDSFHETGNRLLAGWGKQTQAQIESLFEGENPVLEEAGFVPYAGPHLLSKLQNAILDLRELDPGSILLDEHDRSVELHLCHSRIRELEVLHDRLLGLFKTLPGLRPDEILVLTPDLESCAPLIEAVFGTAPRERAIPWRITGRGRLDDNPVARAICDVLALASGNAPASQVFDFLRQPLLAAHFGLDESALEQVRDWIGHAGIRWGLDSKQAHAAGASNKYTFQTGLARLFLSWAAGRVAGRACFEGQSGVAVAPQGSAGLTLGAFWDYADVLNRLCAELLKEHDAEGWRTLLLESLAALVGEAPGYAEEMRLVREAIDALANDIALGHGNETAFNLPLDVIRLALEERLEESARSSIPGGEVTFGALSALRGLPYRVICLIGLDDEAFPARVRADEFDLMSAFPQKGDYQRRDDERNLFLDLILASREVLHLSCVGRSARDNAELPPSVLVDELLDTLAAASALHPEQPESVARARARLIVQHPLQSFSPDYFVADGKRDIRLENFRGEFARALAERSRSLQGDAGEQAQTWDDEASEVNGDIEEESVGKPFFTLPLAPPPEDWRCVDLAQLKEFFRNPCRFLLRARLGLDLPTAEEELNDAEPFVPDGTARRLLAERLLPVLLEEVTEGRGGIADDDLFRLARAGGEFPDGNLGEGALRRELVSLRTFAHRVHAALASACRQTHVIKLAFTLNDEAWELRAAFGALRETGMVAYRYADIQAQDVLAAWLDHLALCAAPPKDVECVTRGISRNGGFILRPVSEAQAKTHLGALLAHYRVGLTAPLRFFPKSSWEYVQSLANSGDEDKAHKAAAKKWNEGDFAEKNNAAYRLALRGWGEREIFDDVFQVHSKAIFEPVLQVFEKVLG
jgi:exodeoxyribonuclease V gamma subunit